MFCVGEKFSPTQTFYAVRRLRFVLLRRKAVVFTKKSLNNLKIPIDLQAVFCYCIDIRKGVIFMDWAAIIWAVLLVGFVIAEAACPIHLISLWFAVGALAATVASFLGAAVWLQIVLFLSVSGILLAALWPVTRKFLNPAHTATNVDAMIGTEGYITVDVDNLGAAGKAKLGGMEWTARSSDGKPISAGTRVKVERIEGVKAIVAPVAEETKV